MSSIRVKALEWKYPAHGIATADTEVGRYMIEDRGPNWSHDRFWATLRGCEDLGADRRLSLLWRKP